MKNQKNYSWEKLEQKWRSQLQNHSIQPSEQLWNKIEEKLSQVEPQKIGVVSKNPFRNYWTWAAIFAIGIGLNWMYFNNVETELPKVSNSTVPQAISTQAPKEMSQKAFTKTKPNKLIPMNIQRLSKNESSIENNPENITAESVQLVGSSEVKNQPMENQTAQNTPEEVWVKVSIDPIPEGPNTEKIAEVKPEEKKKKSFFKLIKQLKNILNGENNIEKAPDNITGSIHQVANTYYRTEEKFKQTFQ